METTFKLARGICYTALLGVVGWIAYTLITGIVVFAVIAAPNSAQDLAQPQIRSQCQETGQGCPTPQPNNDITCQRAVSIVEKLIGAMRGKGNYKWFGVATIVEIAEFPTGETLIITGSKGLTDLPFPTELLDSSGAKSPDEFMNALRKVAGKNLREQPNSANYSLELKTDRSKWSDCK